MEREEWVFLCKLQNKMEEFAGSGLIPAFENLYVLISKHFKVQLAYLISSTNAFMYS